MTIREATPIELTAEERRALEGWIQRAGRSEVLSTDNQPRALVPESGPLRPRVRFAIGVGSKSDVGEPDDRTAVAR
jgi:hypothetical protein